MGTGSLVTPNGIYRTPGRVPDAARIARPSWRTLLCPIARSSAWVFLTIAPLVLFNAWIVPTFLLGEHDGPFIPTFDFIQDGLALLALASPLVLTAFIVRRVRPSWRGLRLRTKILYVTALIMAQSAIVVAAEYALFESRGGLHLFAPILKATISASDGRTAFIYDRGLGCGYTVYVAQPYSLIMRPATSVSRSSCQEPLPSVQWKTDGSVGLVDSTGATLESQPSSWGFSWGGGC